VLVGWLVGWLVGFLLYVSKSTRSLPLEFGQKSPSSMYVEQSKQKA